MAKYQNLPDGHSALIVGAAGMGTPSELHLLFGIGKLYLYGDEAELRTEGFEKGVVKYAYTSILNGKTIKIGVMPTVGYGERMGIEIPFSSNEKFLNKGIDNDVILNRWGNPGKYDGRAVVSTATLKEGLFTDEGVCIDELVRQNVSNQGVLLHNHGQILNERLSQLLYDFQLGQGQFERN